MKALTVRQPYASLICKGIKNVENRSWQTHYRGTVLIHAAQMFYDFTPAIPGQATVQEIQILTNLNEAVEEDLYGCIIGAVDIVGCVKNYPSIWAENNYWHWVLRDAVIFSKPIYTKGQLSLWNVNDSLITKINKALSDTTDVLLINNFKNLCYKTGS